MDDVRALLIEQMAEAMRTHHLQVSPVRGCVVPRWNCSLCGDVGEDFGVHRVAVALDVVLSARGSQPCETCEGTRYDLMVLQAPHVDSPDHPDAVPCRECSDGTVPGERLIVDLLMEEERKEFERKRDALLPGQAICGYCPTGTVWTRSESKRCPVCGDGPVFVERTDG